VRRTVLVAIAALLVGTSAFAQSNKIKIELEGQTVIAKGVTKGGEVAILYVGRERAFSQTHVIRQDFTLTDADREGAVKLDFKRPIPLRSVWAVVDVSSGAIGIARAGYEVRTDRRIQPSASTFAKDGTPALFRVECQYAQGLLVRPGEGVWPIALGDGSGLDEDGTTDGGVSFSVSSVRRHSSKSRATPASFLKRDYVLLINSQSLTSSVVALSALAK
jgi:hypothetical protein